MKQDCKNIDSQPNKLYMFDMRFKYKRGIKGMLNMIKACVWPTECSVWSELWDRIGLKETGERVAAVFFLTARIWSRALNAEQREAKRRSERRRQVRAMCINKHRCCIFTWTYLNVTRFVSATIRNKYLHSWSYCWSSSVHAVTVI